MAGDWIKFESTTPDKPEVVRMAAILQIDQDAVIGKLLRVWTWADQNSLDGNDVSVTSAFLDRIAFCPGFTAAMREVGWLAGDDSRFSLPNFERHNGKTAKRRAVTAKRVAEFRGSSNADRTQPVTPSRLHKALPEKRRDKRKSSRTSKSESRTHASDKGPRNLKEILGDEKSEALAQKLKATP